MHKAVVGGVVVGIAIAVILILRVVVSDVSNDTDFAYHVLLSGEDVYENGVYSETFDMAAGDYKFKFIPNGDSPQMLSIEINGESFAYSEDFELDGTLHLSPISEYYTWTYLGQKEFQLAQGQSLDITINPNGNTQGTVSVIIAMT